MRRGLTTDDENGRGRRYPGKCGPAAAVRSNPDWCCEPGVELDPGCASEPPNVAPWSARRRDCAIAVHPPRPVSAVEDSMEVVYSHCAGLDVHKKTVVACRLVPGPDGELVRETRTFGTLAADLAQLG